MDLSLRSNDKRRIVFQIQHEKEIQVEQTNIRNILSSVVRRLPSFNIWQRFPSDSLCVAGSQRQLEARAFPAMAS
jgi:hypothetical protein